MLDRQKLETILMRRFPGATSGQIAAAANGIMGLDDEWVEDEAWSYVEPRMECRDSCVLARELDPCGELRVFRRRLG